MSNICINIKASLSFAVYFCFSEKHERSLKQVLDGGGGDCERKTPYNKTDVAVVLGEHLLRQLTSEKSYTIDSHMETTGKCKCGLDHCTDKPQFGSTGIGEVI